MRIVDLATAMAPALQQKIVGIRPGEKLHEIMCPTDDSHLTIEFDQHFVIKPAIQFAEERDFMVDAVGGRGSAVAQGFEFHSGTNPNFLSIEQIVGFNRLSEIP